MEQLSLYFTWHEATWLPSWGVRHIPSAEEKSNIEDFAHKMDDLITRYLDKIPEDEFSILDKINVHCWIRPNKVNAPGTEYHGLDYNKFIGGSRRSAHVSGQAVDWSLEGYDCNKIRVHQVPWLKELGLRCENNQGNWIHNDCRKPIWKRFFSI